MAQIGKADSVECGEGVEEEEDGNPCCQKSRREPSDMQFSVFAIEDAMGAGDEGVGRG